MSTIIPDMNVADAPSDQLFAAIGRASATADLLLQCQFEGGVEGLAGPTLEYSLMGLLNDLHKAEKLARIVTGHEPSDSAGAAA